MARITRIALDIALVSIKTVRPAITKLWRGSKNYILETSAKRLVENNFVTKAEYALHDATHNIEQKLTALRDRQLPKEIEYLEKELQSAKEKIRKDKESTAKAVKPAVGTAWKYAKIEMAPPCTVGYFTGRGGRKIEEFVSKATYNLITSLENMIRDIEAEKLRQFRLKEEAAKAAHEKIKKDIRIAKEKIEKALKAKQAEKAKEIKSTEAKQEPQRTPAKPKGRKKPNKNKPSKHKPKRKGKK